MIPGAGPEVKPDGLGKAVTPGGGGILDYKPELDERVSIRLLLFLFVFAHF